MSGLRQRRGGGSHNDDDDGKSKSRKGISLESFDLYQKVQADEAVQTSTGATVSLVSYVIIALLVIYELYGYFMPKVREHMLVDSVIEGRLRIDFDITFPALHCGEVNLDAMDVAGEQQNGIDHDITKTRLGFDGLPIGSSFAATLASQNETDAPLPADYCGSCYGAGGEGQCCNTCDDVRQAYVSKGWDSTDVLRDSEQCKRDAKNPGGVSRPGEGCRIAGMMSVNKVAGNFHIAMGETHARGAGHIHQFNPTQILKYNVTHIIHKLSFGESLKLADTTGSNSYSMRGPLDGVYQRPVEGAGVYMYYIKVIPTVFSRPGSDNVTTNQYSVTRQYRPAVVNGQRQNVLPGLFFVYDVSPFMIRLTASYTPLVSVLTNLCAILGGVIAAATLVDQVLYRMSKAAKGIGKSEGGGGPVGPAAGGAQGALVDALAGAVTQVAKAGAQFAGSPAAQYGVYGQGPAGRPSFGSAPAPAFGSTSFTPSPQAAPPPAYAQGGYSTSSPGTGSAGDPSYAHASGYAAQPDYAAAAQFGASQYSASGTGTGTGTGGEEIMYGGSADHAQGAGGMHNRQQAGGGYGGGPGMYGGGSTPGGAGYEGSMGGSKQA